MTVKEMATIAGCNRDTVIDTIKKEFPYKVKNGQTTRLNLDEANRIMTLLPKRNYVQPMEKPTDNSIGEIVRETIKGLLPLVQTMIQENNKLLLGQNQIKQIPFIQDYYSIKGYCSLKNIIITHSEAIGKGKECRALSVETGKEVRSVPDEQYGKVNSYHIDVLEKVFEL